MTAHSKVSDELIEKARKAGGHLTKEAAVNAALEEYVRRRQKLQILELFGTVDFNPEYDYKANRRRDSHR
jgi:Arc/MetJ family transcription regulator